MVRVDSENQRVIIEMEKTNVEEITDMQEALIDLIQNYRYNDFGNDCELTIMNACNLLRAIMPNYEQQKRGFDKYEALKQIKD